MKTWKILNFKIYSLDFKFVFLYICEDELKCDDDDMAKINDIKIADSKKGKKKNLRTLYTIFFFVVVFREKENLI